MGEMLVSKLDQAAQLPQRQHHDDAGLDLYSVEAVTLKPEQRRLVRTGIKAALPPGTVGFVTPRSGTATKYGVTVINSPGTIDAGYRGEILVGLVNLGHQSYTVDAGDRIAQMVVLKVETPRVTEVEFSEATARGSGGIGSTGK